MSQHIVYKKLETMSQWLVEINTEIQWNMKTMVYMDEYLGQEKSVCC